MVTKKSLIMVSLVTILGLLVVGCAPSAPPTPTARAAAPAAALSSAAPAAATAAGATPKPAAPSTTPKPAAESAVGGRYGGILTVGVSGDPPSMDIHREEAATAAPFVAGAYNGLVKYDPKAWPEPKVIGELAASWDLSPDGKTYTFHLVKGVKFHDGSSLTAEDVKYSFDRIRDPQLGLVKSPRRPQLANVASIDAPDDSTVKITLGYPQASFISMIGPYYFAVMPKRVVLDKKGDMTKTMVGTGAFKFKDYAAGVNWELVKNTNYFVEGRPYLDGVKGYIISDPFTRFAALRTRNILWWAPPSPYMTVSQAKIIDETLSDKITVQWAFHPAWYGVVFNVNRPPWNDVRVRQAASMAFDRKKMLAVGLEGAGVPGMSAQPPSEWALPEDEMMKVPGYAKPDVEAAKKLLAEAGFGNGFKTDSLVRSTAVQQKLAELFRDAVAAIGITVDLNIQETAVFYDQQYRKVFSTMAGSAGAGLTDPDTFLGEFYITGSERNYGGYSNPQYDELNAKQMRTLDKEERRKIVWEMQRILLKDVPIAIAYWTKVPYAWWKEVQGFTPPTSHYHAYMYQEMWLTK